MKLEKLRTHQRQLERELSQESVEATLYYYFEDKWRELDTGKPVDDATAAALKRAKSESIAYHATSGLRAWYYFKTSDYGVSLKFAQSPQLGTRRKFRDRLTKIEESATNAYKVSHNSLTHLLARDAFRAALDQAIAALTEQIPTSPDAQESGLPRTLAVMALDIDHFKQVNDTWGHLYGDQVLKTFGIRLEQCAHRILASAASKPSVTLGHPSGEEFLIIISANASRQQFDAWANEFRSAIADDVLPSDTEWDWLASQGGLGVLVPPPLHDRSLTTSIGVALHSTISQTDSGTEPSASLLDRADTALYRAKAAGRNQVIFFDEILTLCGRVLEQDPTTRVVAIDIGANVGVSVGQEFKAFPPTYTGSKKFTINDGRTTRTLGTYPRVQSARLIVFNAQPEISFAIIASPEDSATAIEPGSHLEAIPAGSIGHLLPTASKYFPALPESLGGSGLTTLQSFIKASTDGNAKPFAIVIRCTHEAEYLRKYGTAALNLAIAKIFRAAQSVFHAAKAIEVLDRGSICVAGTKAAYKESMIVDFVNEQAAELPELGLFAGVFCDDDYKGPGKDNDPALKPEHAIEFARFAASEHARSPDSRVRHFSNDYAARMLQALREAQLFEIAYADFERLRKLGVETSELFNLAGLLAGSLGMRKEAVDHYQAAIAKGPKNLIYKSNFATAAYRIGDVESALKVMNQVPLKDIDSLHQRHPYGYVTYARLLARAKLQGSSHFDEARFTHIAQAALALPESSGGEESKVIAEALLQL